MNKLSGFTLIELIVVMALIMILSVVGIGAYLQATTKSMDTQRKNDLNQIAKAIETYYTDMGKYPSDLSEVDPDYISIPEDPDPSLNYVYKYNVDGYSLFAVLQNVGDKDLIVDGFGNVFEYDESCGDLIQCNYQITETGLVK